MVFLKELLACRDKQLLTDQYLEGLALKMLTYNIKVTTYLSDLSDSIKKLNTRIHLHDMYWNKHVVRIT